MVLSCVITDWWMISYILKPSPPETMLSTAVIVKYFSQAAKSDDGGRLLVRLTSTPPNPLSTFIRTKPQFVSTDHLKFQAK